MTAKIGWSKVKSIDKWVDVSGLSEVASLLVYVCQGLHKWGQQESPYWNLGLADGCVFKVAHI